MPVRYDEQEKKYFEYCDTFKDGRCSRCGRPMGNSIGSVRCRRDSKPEHSDNA